MRTPATRFEDLVVCKRPTSLYGDVDEWHRLLEKISKLLEAYSRAILNSDS